MSIYDTLYNQVASIELKNLIGHEYDFYGAFNNKFKLDNVIFEVLENESDGYRSYFGLLILSPDADETGFFSKPIAKIKIVETYFQPEVINEDFSGYSLIDVIDNHVWLEFGTNYLEDYYPFMVFTYFPKENI